MTDRKPTKIERLAPALTAIADEMGDEIRYYGGDYFLLHAQQSLWNSRRDGGLTQHGAEQAVDALRRLADATAPERAKPPIERAMAVVERLRPVQWRPGFGTEVTTPALDRGYLTRDFGTYHLVVRVHGESVDVRDIRDRDAAFDALAGKCREKWGTP